VAKTHIFIDASLGEEFEEFELAEGSYAKEGMVEGENLFYSDLATGRFV
jgi:hypothetical protein